MTLTIAEIKDLALFAGLKIAGEILEDDGETEIAIGPCPTEGVQDDNGTIEHYRFIAYFAEYPEEGCYPLGSKLPEGQTT